MGTPDNLLKVERHNHIRKLVEQTGRVTVSELSDQFQVSEATIRRDLEEMDGQGWVQRTHGGALRIERASKEPPILQRIEEGRAEKQRIGKAAAAMVKDGETIFLGSGTTVLEIARNLPSDIHLTIITNSLPIVNELSNRPNIEMIVIGGMLRQTELSMVGHIAEQAVHELRADKVFMGMRAIDARHGFTHDYLPETMTDRAILSIASHVIVVADHRKFCRVSSVFVGPITLANTIITDRNTAEDYVTELKEMKIEIMQV